MVSCTLLTSSHSACGNEKLHKTWQGKESAQAKEPPDTQEVEVPAVGAGGDS